MTEHEENQVDLHELHNVQTVGELAAFLSKCEPDQPLCMDRIEIEYSTSVHPAKRLGTLGIPCRTAGAARINMNAVVLGELRLKPKRRPVVGVALMEALRQQESFNQARAKELARQHGGTLEDHVMPSHHPDHPVNYPIVATPDAPIDGPITIEKLMAVKAKMEMAFAAPSGNTEPPCVCDSPAMHMPDCEWLVWNRKRKR